MKFILCSLFLLSMCCITKAQSTTDKQAIERAVLNYVEGVYTADTSMIEASVAKHLAKRGYYTRNDTVRDATMSYDQLVRLTKRWSSNQKDIDKMPKQVVVFDVLDKIASVKLVAHWGIDYFHLYKDNGKWTIINVLWQEHPKK
ncbi:nuclear transport factor 2 family protein [Aridibaculum aurantiacum]|uniref:nuclear transport factor 2 family protein n=1 Tax=Aridibaculum aurantiacum TaxID=2810307 RepID=UPI001A96BAB6|nr:nuclear transport factor 2 family protein [Aridibaculum aurantiacum]